MDPITAIAKALEAQFTAIGQIGKGVLDLLAGKQRQDLVETAHGLEQLDYKWFYKPPHTRNYLPVVALALLTALIIALIVAIYLKRKKS